MGTLDSDMSAHMDIFRAQLQSYADAWRRQFATPFECWELQLQLRLALNLYDFAAAVAEHRAHEGRAKGEVRDQFIRETHSLYAIWFEPSRSLLGVLKERRAGGCVFEGLSRLDMLCYHIEGFLRFNVEDTIQALHDVDEGRCIPIDEARNELRRRSNARVPQ